MANARNTNGSAITASFNNTSPYVNYKGTAITNMWLKTNGTPTTDSLVWKDVTTDFVTNLAVSGDFLTFSVPQSATMIPALPVSRCPALMSSQVSLLVMVLGLIKVIPSPIAVTSRLFSSPLRAFAAGTMESSLMGSATIGRLSRTLRAARGSCTSSRTS